MIGEAIGAAAMLGIGWLTKHRTKIDHKTTGVPTNVALGQAVAVLTSHGTLPPEAVMTKGAAIWVVVEAAVQAGKWIHHLLRGRSKR